MSAAEEPVGSLAEEAAKLLGALAGADFASQALRDVDEHLGAGADECRYCPLCRTVHAVRRASPEVRTHLATAASALLQAAAGLVAAAAAGAADPRPADGVERIDLEDDVSEWPDDWDGDDE